MQIVSVAHPDDSGYLCLIERIPFSADSIRLVDHPFEHTAGGGRVRLSEADVVHWHLAEHNYVDVVLRLLLQRVHEIE